MTKKELMKYIGKDVTITFTDGTIYAGTLEYVTEKRSGSKFWFILCDIAFKAKHVKKFGEDRI